MEILPVDGRNNLVNKMKMKEVKWEIGKEIVSSTSFSTEPESVLGETEGNLP